MKKFTRIAASLLCAALLLCCVSCMRDRDESLPDGMQLATAAGADYRLYIPTSWNLNTDYGASGGYYNMNTQSTVSVAKYPITEEMSASLAQTDISQYEGEKLGWFWLTYCLPPIDSMALSGSRSDVTAEPDLLNQLNARRFTVCAIVNGTTLYFTQVVTEKDNAFYVFSYTADAELYEALLSDVESMLDYFVFDEPYYPDDYVKDLDNDENVPEGMQLASNSDVAYRFYVPTSWKINRDEEIFAAYLESDRSSVSVVPYLPDEESMSVAEFYTLCEKMMIETAGENGFALLSHETVDLGGRQATAYVYTYTVGGVQYQYMQVIAAYKSMLYSLTYTSLPQNFDAHLDDVNAMIDAFEFT